MSEVFNEYFASVFTKEKDMIDGESREGYVDILGHVNIKEEVVFDVSKSIKVDKSPGPDGIYLRILREAALTTGHHQRMTAAATFPGARVPGHPGSALTDWAPVTTATIARRPTFYVTAAPEVRLLMIIGAGLCYLFGSQIATPFRNGGGASPFLPMTVLSGFTEEAGRDRDPRLRPSILGSFREEAEPPLEEEVEVERHSEVGRTLCRSGMKMGMNLGVPGADKQPQAEEEKVQRSRGPVPVLVFCRYYSELVEFVVSSWKALRDRMVEI
eukprot:g37518.t1